MPRKATTTREDMIDAAFSLIREEGHEAFSARRLAQRLHCSTQPIMYRFPNLSELYELIYQQTDRLHTQYLMAAHSFLDMGLRYIEFASEERNLFRFLFQSGHFDGDSVRDLMHKPETEAIVNIAVSEIGLPREKAYAIFETMFAVVHGYASLIANNAMVYDFDAVSSNLVALAENLIGKEN